MKPEEKWVLSSVEPIVSADLWDRCNSIRAGNRERRQSFARRPTHLFAGFAFCHCGTKMDVWSNSPKYICSKCRNKIPVGDLEAVYREQLRHFLLSPNEITAHRQAADEEALECERLIESARAELRKIEAEDERLYQLYIAESLSKEDFGRRHRPLSECRKQLEDELPRLEARLDGLRIGTASHAEAVTEAQSLWSGWDDLPPEDRRQIVEAITDRIIVGRDDVEIRLLHLPFGNDAEKATRSCGRVAFLMPGVRTRLRAVKPEVKQLSGNDLAACLRRRRRELGLFQKDVAKRLGVTPDTLLNWEKGRCQPPARYGAILLRSCAENHRAAWGSSYACL